MNDQLYAKDEKGQIQQLVTTTDENGYRSTTAHIYGDVEGLSIGINFGWQSDKPSDELNLEFDGDVDVAYSSDDYKGVTGGGFMVGTDTMDMTLKFQEGKTIYVGAPLDNSIADAAFELCDYIDREGNSDPVNMTILGGNIVTHFDRAVSNHDFLAGFGAAKNKNGPIDPGVIRVNNDSIISTLGYDYSKDGVDTYGAYISYNGGFEVTTGYYQIGEENSRFTNGISTTHGAHTTLNTNKFFVFATDYGLRADSGANITLSNSQLAQIDSEKYGVLANEANVDIENNKTVNVFASKYGLWSYAENAQLNINNTEELNVQAVDEAGVAVMARQGHVAIDGSKTVNLAGSQYGLRAYSSGSEITIRNTDTLNVYAPTQSDGATAEAYGDTDIKISANTVNFGQNVEGSKGIWTRSEGSVTIEASQFEITGNKNTKDAIYANTGTVDIDASTLSIATTSTLSSYQISAYNSATVNLNQKTTGALNFRGGMYATSGSTINADLAKDSKWEGFAKLGDGNINLKFADQAKWQLAYASEVSSIQFENGGSIDLFNNTSGDYKLLTTKTLNGQGGTLGFRIDLTNDSTTLSNDQLEITEKASGNHFATISFIGDSIPVDKLYSEHWLVSQADSDASGVTFKNHDGTNRFTGNGMITTWSLLFTQEEIVDENTKWQETGNGQGYWHLVQTDSVPVTPDPGPGGGEEDPPLPPEAEQIQNLGSSVAQAVGWLSEKNDLRRRLGEVRYGSQAGAWAKVFTRQDRAEGFRYNGFKQESTGIHIGYDTFATKNEDAAWLVGATFRYAQSKQEGIETAYGGDGKLNEYSAKIYATWMHESGSYMDILAQVGYYDQEINGLNNVGDGSFDANYHNWGYGASVEIGHMFTIVNASDDRPWYNHWFIEPQLELSYFYVKGEDFKTSTGLKVSQGNADFLTGRAGLVIGKKVNYGTTNDLDKRWYQVGVIGGVTHEFLGDQTIKFTGTEGKSAEVKGHGLGGTSFYYGVTADWQINDSVRIYGEISREEGQHYTKDYGVNLGLKYSF